MNKDKIKELRKSIIESKTFCFMPFVQISTNPAGHFRPCCMYQGPLWKGNEIPYSIMQGDTFDTVWNSPNMIKIRTELTNGIEHDRCIRCIRDGDTSMRSQSVQVYKNDIEALESVLSTIENNYEAVTPPSYLELKPSNLCNLKCVMCNSYDSSQIAKEIKELSEKFKGIIVGNGRFIEISSTPGITEANKTWQLVEQPDWSDKEEIWESFERMAPYVRTLSFAGGEPTIMPSVLKVLQFVVDNNFAKNITVFLSSNYTNLNKKFFELMTHFKKFELISSIDGFDKVNDYCRYPSKWSQVSKNYIAAKEYMSYPNVKIMSNITVSILNVLNLDDLLYWIEERSEEYPYYREWPYNLNLIISPGEQSIHHLPDNLKKVAVDRLNAYLASSSVIRQFPGLDSKVQLIIDQLSRPAELDKLKIFQDRVRVLDEHRGISITDYIPDLAEVFKK